MRGKEDSDVHSTVMCAGNVVSLESANCGGLLTVNSLMCMGKVT